MGRPAILKVDILADGKQANRELAQTESRFGRFGKAAARAGKVAALGLGAGLAAAGVAAFKLAQGAAEDEQAAANLANTLKNATGATDKHVAATERWITKQGKALGVADDELRPALGRLAAVTGDLGKTQELTALSMDIAAGTGKSLEQVTTALAKAQTGSVGGLSRLGVATKDAAGNTLSLEQITGKLAKTYKGAAATAADTTAGKWARVKLQMSEMGETIGSKLLPIGLKLAGWALKLAPKLQHLGAELGKRLGPAFARVGGFITDRLVPAAQNIHAWFIDKIVPGIKKYLTPILAGARKAFAQVSEAVDRNRPSLEKLFSAVKKVAEFLANHVLPIVGKGVGKAFEIFGGAIGDGIDMVARIVGWLDTAISKIQDLIGWVKNIKIPDIDIPFVGGSVGNLLTVTHQLVGDSPSYDGRRGWSTFTADPFARASASSSWATITGAGGVRPAGGTTVLVDARTTVEVDNRASLTDEATLARRLDRVLAEHSARMGRRLSGGRLVTP